MFRLQVTIIRQIFQYMDMTCSVLTVWDPICSHVLCRMSDIQCLTFYTANVSVNTVSTEHVMSMY